jgi:hypothetical protein
VFFSNQPKRQFKKKKKKRREREGRDSENKAAFLKIVEKEGELQRNDTHTERF